MYIKALSMYLFLVGTTTAQTATLSPASTSSSASGSTSTATSLPGLINELPKCALSCLETGAKTIGCSVSDLTCLCSNTSSLISSVGGCILTSSCSSDEISQASDIAPQICSDVNNADAAEIASASSLIADALSTAGASSTTSGNAAARTDVAMGMMGAAAAFAAFAL